jgi:hypothetical protein
MRKLQALRFLARQKLDRPVSLDEYAELVKPAPDRPTGQPVPSLAQRDLASIARAANMRQVQGLTCCSSSGRYDQLIGAREMLNQPSDVARITNPVPRPMRGDHPIKGTKKDPIRDYSHLRDIPDSSMLADLPKHRYAPASMDIPDGIQLSEIQTTCTRVAQGDFQITHHVETTPLTRTICRPSAPID